MWLGVVTLFPDLVAQVANFGVVSRAKQQQLFELELFNPRDFTQDRHQTVDDRPYGGGPGMVMKVAPLQLALESAKAAAPSQAKVVYLSPQGQVLTQPRIQAWGEQSQPLILLCGRYEGVDERLIDSLVDEEWSVGDYVLSGGEIPAMTVIDALVRLIPGALGHENSAKQDSFSEGILDCPHYTRPEDLAGQRVPEVLMSGNHEYIRRWRLQQALGRTWLRRPELLQNQSLNEEQLQLLDEFQQQWQQHREE